MARVTIEDCMTKVHSRFELVVLAAERVKEIASGSPITVDRQRDKNPVVALREIADGNIDVNVLRDLVVKKYRTVRPQAEKDLADEDGFFAEAGGEISSADISSNEMFSIVSEDELGKDFGDFEETDEELQE